ncbi:MAG TPA: hypothetical protein VMU43_14740 [Candidatus Acidoferrum sp.]|nr:hypothetical protein [Candidatus Acidoferrum sp.]
MRVEEFERLSRKLVRFRANEAFDAAEKFGIQNTSKLLEAQFYMRELEHRYDSRISIRDFILEIVVILLIGWEIGLGYQQERQQRQAFNAQLQVLENLQKSTDTTANSLILAQANLSQMNQALQKQLGLFYDVSLAVLFNQSQSKTTIINQGRTNVVIWGRKFDDESPVMEKEGRTISTSGTGLEIPDPNLIPSLAKLVPKGATKLIPFEIYIKNERGEEFVAHCYFSVSWSGETMNVTTQTASIVPEHWSRTLPMQK